jgi:hypothetical protein
VFCDKKVIVVIPAGRKRYLEILIPYLLNPTNRAIIDECRLWLNTDVEEDIAYIKSLQSDFIKIDEYNNPKNIHRIASFLSLAPNNSNIIYLRLDDDICFVDSNAILNLVKFRYENPNYFLVYGNIANNSRMDVACRTNCSSTRPINV